MTNDLYTEEARMLKKTIEEQEYGIDPITIIMLVGLIINIIRVIQECRENAPGIKRLLERPYMKRQVDRILASTLSPKEYILYGDQLNYLVRKRGEEMDEIRLQQLIDGLEE